MQLVQGRVKALEAGDPIRMLNSFAAFSHVQVIDLDAAIGPESNEPIVIDLARRARVRAGGGVRTVEKAGRLIDSGVDQVIIGTAAFTSHGVDHDFLRALAMTVPVKAISVALDSKEGRIVVKGWRESLTIAAEDVVHELEPYCSAFLCTYVDKEGMMQGTDLDWFRTLRRATAHEITAAGGITTYDEIRALQQMNVHAALGMALYTGRLELGQLAAMQI